MRQRAVVPLADAAAMAARFGSGQGDKPRRATRVS
jgi:hypothetical protein